MPPQGLGGASHAATKPVAAFVRAFGPGDSGPDVRAVKRALLAAGQGAGINAGDAKFGAAAVKDLENFQRMCHLPATGRYDEHTNRFLAPFFDQYSHALISKEAVRLAAQKKLAAKEAAARGPKAIRAEYLKAMAWGVDHHGQFTYREARPMPVHVQPYDVHASFVTDCSGWDTIAARWVEEVLGLPAGTLDPNGLRFNGQGYTGTMLAHCQHVPWAQAQPADLVVYGPPPGGYHVSALYKKQGSDWMTVTNGHQGCPAYQLHSGMAQWMAEHGHPGTTVCRFLPV